MIPLQAKPTTIVGFTFIRNAIRYDYPIVEAIQSILPLCDSVVVAVGQSSDDTLNLIKNIPTDKIKIIETVWEDSLRKGGQVLAIETNKAFDAVPPEADWCIYIQGDEVLHEESYPAIRNALQKWQHDRNTEGFILKYRHFYGSYDYIGVSRGWYRHEVRIIRNDKSIRSYRDAQGFRKNGKKLKVRLIDGYMHHYGWVRHPQAQQLKQLNFNRYWHTDVYIQNKIPDVHEYDYTQSVSGLVRFDGQHPSVIKRRIEALNWSFYYNPALRKISLKERLSEWIERLTGWRIGEYKNYQLIDE